MRQKSLLALAAGLILLTGCHQGGGGGGPNGRNEGNSPVSYGNSNPVTREQSSSKSLPLRAAPNNGGRIQPGEGVISSKTTVIARGGQAVLKVNANKASASELQQVPGIGSDTASAIVRNRPYKNADDLAKKTGINPNRVASFKQFLTF